ncbi:MAG: ATP-grasp domain-containing protein [Gaiellaceae bacterium]
MGFVIAAEKRTQTDQQLAAALSRYCVDAAIVSSADVPARVRAGDTVLGRIALLPSLDGVQGCVWDLRQLERLSVRILNPASALLATHDKLMTALRLARSGIHHPKTAHVDHDDAALPELTLPVVVKPRFGSRGHDVVRCDDRLSLQQGLQKLRGKRWFRRQGALVQELVGAGNGSDTRLLVCRGELVGGIERRAASGWRADDPSGRISVATPTAAERRLAVRAAEAFGADLVVVELLATDDGPVVLELDVAAEFDETYAFDGQDVFDEVARRLVDSSPLAHADALRVVGA